MHPPASGLLRLISLGDTVPVAKMVLLSLQAYDTQSGISLSFHELDYDKVIAWLERAVALDPDSQYPFMAASRVYAEVSHPAKQRQMLNFVFREFLLRPNDRWMWLAHAVFVAKHRLHDLPLALQYAKALAEHATDSHVPHWAQQMHLFVLMDLGEVDSARLLLTNLLASGTVTDPHEKQLLEQRLTQLNGQR